MLAFFLSVLLTLGVGFVGYHGMGKMMQDSQQLVDVNADDKMNKNADEKMYKCAGSRI